MWTHGILGGFRIQARAILAVPRLGSEFAAAVMRLGRKGGGVLKFLGMPTQDPSI